MGGMAKDLQSYLREYEERNPCDVLRVGREISLKYEITAYVWAFQKLGKYPILIFENVRLGNGERSPWPVVTNLVSTRKRAADAAGLELATASKTALRKIQTERRPPLKVRREEAPCKEVIRKVPGEMTLFDLPVPHYTTFDGGPFLSSGYLTVQEPHTRIDNSNLVRGNIWEEDCVGVGIVAAHNKRIYQMYEEAGRDMPVCYWIGHHPAALMGGQAKLKFPESHFEAMGAMLGEPLRIAPSETLGEDFWVPADAEFVIEGFVPAGRRAPEGPFAEYPHYYGAQRWSPFMKVTCITHRKDALFHALTPGSAEQHLIGIFGKEGKVYEVVKGIVDGVQNVHMPLSGTSTMHVYLQVRKRKPSDGREAVLAALLSDRLVKHAIAVDEDVDIFDEREVLWAVAAHTQWDKDVIILPKMMGGERDPSGNDPPIDTKGGIDATRPLPAEKIFPPKITVPREIREAINAETISRLFEPGEVDGVPIPKLGEI